ncbi:MAG TPA: hypothetical protein VFV99_05795, partial [Kofleriaceae bacterium]|nr:hypothetical protein [Kofleriaceae bacterium]
ASLALAGDVAVTTVERRLRLAGTATSALPIKLEYIYATLRDAGGRVIGIPDGSCRSRTGETHELALEQFIGASTLAATRSIELSVPYKIEVSNELAIARLGPPAGDGRVPLDITRRGAVPFVDIVSIAAYFNAGAPIAAYRGLQVFVELDVRRGARGTYCTVSGRVRLDGDKVLGEERAYPGGPDSDTTRRIYEIPFRYTEGTATQLELAITVDAVGIGRLGPIAVEGL